MDVGLSKQGLACAGFKRKEGGSVWKLGPIIPVLEKTSPEERHQCHHLCRGGLGLAPGGCVSRFSFHHWYQTGQLRPGGGWPPSASGLGEGSHLRPLNRKERENLEAEASRGCWNHPVPLASSPVCGSGRRPPHHHPGVGCSDLCLRGRVSTQHYS